MSLLVTTIGELRERLRDARRAGKTIGLVPTMGALHEGHLSLVRASRGECGFTAVTIYVNPSQFGPHEDFSQYPRTLQQDLDLLSAQADVVFAPRDEEVYPPGYSTWVEVGSVAQPLEGVCRPGHFRGVATIVLKLFAMTWPDVAYFGQKDYQQALVVRRMATDLNLPLSIRVCPIVREADGLAMSSRNRYLDPDERRRAAALFQSLTQAADMVARGETSVTRIVEAMRQTLQAADPSQIDYIAIADPETLEPVQTIRGRAVALLAVRIGKTRLIDNMILEPP
jgi:pantoate--beta-alanine ligase